MKPSFLSPDPDTSADPDNSPSGCLFAANALDDPGSFVSLCQWNGVAPFPHVLLLTGEPRLRSLPLPGEPCAIVADYRQGMLRLNRFLARVKHPELQKLREAMVDHLRSPVFRRTYTVMMWRDLLQSRSRAGDADYACLYRELCELNESPNLAWWLWRRDLIYKSVEQWSYALTAMR